MGDMGTGDIREGGEARRLCALGELALLADDELKMMFPFLSFPVPSIPFLCRHSEHPTLMEGREGLAPRRRPCPAAGKEAPSGSHPSLMQST